MLIVGDLPSRTLKPMSFQSRAAGGGGNIAGVDWMGGYDYLKGWENMKNVIGGRDDNRDRGQSKWINCGN